MTFLELCRRTAVECGAASGQQINTALPTVVGATGSLGRIVNWVNDAWGDLQTARDDWDFMRSSNLLGGGVSFTTISGQAHYPLGVGAGTVGVAVDAFGKWDQGTFRAFTTAVGTRDEMFLEDVSFDAWRNSYMLGAMRSVTTRPVVAAIGPDQSLNLGPPPTGAYTVTADYFTGGTNMVLDADVPIGLPTRFHVIIVYQAMAKYAAYESAPEVAQRAAQQNASTYSQLLAARAPRMTWGGALA